MSANGGANKLQYAMKGLRAKWDEIEVSWRDQVRADFEKNHFDPLQSQVETTVRAMSQLADVLARVRRDCSESS